MAAEDNARRATSNRDAATSPTGGRRLGTAQPSPPRPGALKVWLRVTCVTLVFYGIFVLPNFYILPVLLPRRLSLRHATLGVMVGMCLSSGFLLLCLALYRRWRQQSWEALGWRRTATTRTLWLALALALVEALLLALVITPMRVYGTEISGFKLLGLIAGICTAITQEVCWRGWLLSELDAAKISLPLQLLASGLVSSFCLDIPLASGWPLAFIYGLATAWLYHYSGRSLTPVLYSHIALNCLVMPWAIINLVHLNTQYPHPPLPWHF